MNRILASCVMVALALSMSTPSVQASQIVGTSALGAGGITANNANIQLATSISIAGLQIQGASGNFTSGPPTFTVLFGPFVLSLSPAAPSSNTFTFGGAGYGTFTATSFTLDDTSTGSARNVYFKGSFAPGFGGFTTNNNVTLQFSFTQQGGPGSAISGSASLVAPAPAPPQGAVPEPGTFVLALLGIMPFAFARYRTSRSVQMGACSGL